MNDSIDKYKGLGIFKEAAQRKKDGMGYRARRTVNIWQNKSPSWNRFYIEYGIRWSDQWQLLPIWNTSHNSQRSLLFGIWLLYFEVTYYRKSSYSQGRKFPFSGILSRAYQLFF